MATIVQESSTDLPRLSLTVDRPPSSSPFPSPGSPFLPPPSLGAHEFALKPSHFMRSLNTSRKARDVDAEDSILSPTSTDGDATPTVAAPTNSLASALSPITPVPNASFQVQQPSPPPQINTHDTSMVPYPKSQRESLTSSRPAPPSPAPSRRTSAVLSRHSSTAKSRRASKVPSLSHHSEHEKLASSSSAATVTPSTAVASTKRRSWLVKIKDFAFPHSDERHIGRGPDVPRANRPRHRMSTLSVSSSSSSTHEVDEDAEEEQRHHSWSSFRWNTLSSHFNWGRSQTGDEDVGDTGPSSTDFARNFDVSSPTDEEPEQRYSANDDRDDRVEGVEYPTEEDGPLIPGLYRALYVFEPEGTAEMALEEEQIVKVIGRGGGVGWAVVEKEGGDHALVPESYLELVRVDEA